ncbi:ATP-binding protein [Streptomyces mirabilis]|uniref:hypothetical protein n=1 Tax=Streptomyces mirabilis TaxID=68239 RepID=UPI0036C1638C
MERLVADLVGNAVRHNRQDGAGSWIRLWTGLDGGRRPVLRIADSDGLGLGLSVVAAVAMAHGGSVAARPRGGWAEREGHASAALTPYEDPREGPNEVSAWGDRPR